MTPDVRATITHNIEESGFHVYLVVSNQAPSYMYTIGLTETASLEILFVGGAFYDAEELHRIVNHIGDRLNQGRKPTDKFLVKGLGAFTLQKATDSWVRTLMLGAVDYYKGRQVVGYQIVPDRKRWTADVGDTREEMAAPVNRAWRWFRKEWPFDVPVASTATTNLAALQGSRITEAARWEADEWELFAGDGTAVSPTEARIVPLGILLGLDPTLEAVTHLKVGEAILRDAGTGDWQPWKRRNGA